MRALRLVVVALAFASLANASPAPAADLLDCHFVEGWRQEGGTRSFDPDNLFEYMDGNAEGYLVYGFVHMQGITCKSGDDSILIDVFEMADADSAYGVFTANLDPNRPLEKIGMGGQVQPRHAMFAKDKYYVELAANPDKDHTAPLRAFARELENQIAGCSDPPDALAWFPKEKLASLRLIPESVLGVRALKRGYVAQYELGKAFVVTEQSAEAAADVLNKLRRRFGEVVSAQLGDEAFQGKDQYLGGLCVFRKGRYVGGFANLPDGAEAVRRASSLAARIP